MTLDHDERHAAYWAGHAVGYAKGQRAASNALAREALHRMAGEQLGLAQRAALDRHGPAWADAIREQAEAVDAQ